MIRPNPLAWWPTINWDKEPDLDQLRRALALQQENASQGLRELETLAEAGSIASMLHLGYAYEEGKGVELNTTAAEHWYRRATDAGSIDGSFRLGAFYRRQSRFSDAIEAYSIGESQNFPPSIYWLGRMYLNGMGGQPDLNKAVGFWTRASALGHPYATRSLAILSLKGRLGRGEIIKGLALWIAAFREVWAIVKRTPRSDLLK